MRICEGSGGPGKAVAIAAELPRPWCSSDWCAFVDARNMFGYNDDYVQMNLVLNGAALRNSWRQSYQPTSVISW